MCKKISQSNEFKRKFRIRGLRDIGFVIGTEGDYSNNNQLKTIISMKKCIATIVVFGRQFLENLQ
jgi:hypothetical protein